MRHRFQKAYGSLHGGNGTGQSARLPPGHQLLGTGLGHISSSVRFFSYEGRGGSGEWRRGVAGRGKNKVPLSVILSGGLVNKAKALLLAQNQFFSPSTNHKHTIQTSLLEHSEGQALGSTLWGHGHHITLLPTREGFWVVRGGRQSQRGKITHCSNQEWNSGTRRKL